MNTERVTTHARNAYRYLFSKPCNSKLFETEMSNFYAEGMKNPSVAKMIMYSRVINPQISKTAKEVEQETLSIYRRTRTGIPVNASDLKFWMTHRFLGATNVQNEKEFMETFRTLYPKTYGVRDCLIKLGQISMDKVSPSVSKTNPNYAETLKKLLKTQAVNN